MVEATRKNRRAPNWIAVSLLAGLGLLAACTHGRDWDTYGLEIITDPAGAECEFERNGIRTQAHDRTPVEVVLTTGHGSIQITCRRPGYQPESRWVSSFFEGTVYMTMSPVAATPAR